MVKSSLSAQIPAELTQTPPPQRYCHHKDSAEQLPLDLSYFLLEETLDFTSFSRTYKRTVTLGETPQGRVRPGSSGLRLPSTLLQQRGPFADAAASCPETPQRKVGTSWGSQRSHLHLRAAKRHYHRDHPLAIHHLGVGKGGTGTKIRLLCLLMRGLLQTSA